MINWNDISAEDQNELVNSCIDALRTFTRIYGAEDGQAVWDRLTDAMGQDLKSAVFFALITGNGGSISVKGYPLHQKVSLIRIIRAATGLGLKEAKDLSEATDCRFVVKHGEREGVVRQLREIGAVVP